MNQKNKNLLLFREYVKQSKTQKQQSSRNRSKQPICYTYIAHNFPFSAKIIDKNQKPPANPNSKITTKSLSMSIDKTTIAATKIPKNTCAISVQIDASILHFDLVSRHISSIITSLFILCQFYEKQA